MRVHHQTTRPLEVSRGERVGEGGRPTILGNHVRRAFDVNGIQRSRHFSQQRIVDVAKRMHPRVPRVKRGNHTLASRAPVVVGAGRQLAAHTAVEHQYSRGRGNRHIATLERPAVDQKGATFASRRNGQLVHDAAGDTGKLVFSLLAETGGLTGIPRDIG